MIPRLLLIALLVAAAGAASLPAAAQKARKVSSAERNGHRGVPYAGNEEAMRWADEVAQRRGLDADWVRGAVGNAQLLPTVIRLMQPAPTGTPKNWRVYRSRFIDPVRIGAGVKFWQENQATLERAEQKYGVPAEIIVGIIGVETIYGQQMGTFRVIDALATLAFNFPQTHPRATDRIGRPGRTALSCGPGSVARPPEPGLRPRKDDDDAARRIVSRWAYDASASCETLRARGILQSARSPLPP